MKKTTAFLTALLLLFGISLSAYADDITSQNGIQYTGTCGPGMTWTLTSGGLLTVSGSGEIQLPLTVDGGENYYLPRELWQKHVTSLVIEEGVTAIGPAAFSKCGLLEKAEIPATVIEIGDYAFSECKQLTAVVIPEGAAEFGESIFKGCEQLKEVSIPNSLTEIPDEMFSGCKKLSRIDLPESLTRIGIGAFRFCDRLKSIRIPTGIKTIDYAAFEGCASLKEVVLPDTVTEIEERAFSECSSLTEEASDKIHAFHTTASDTEEQKKEPSEGKRAVDAIAARNALLVLYDDGSVSAEIVAEFKNVLQIYERNLDDQDLEPIRRWKDVISLAYGSGIVAGLKSDGTVYAESFWPPYYDNLETIKIERWTDIVSITGGAGNIVGIRRNGTAKIAGLLNYFAPQNNLDCLRYWDKLVKAETGVTAEGIYLYGLKSDGSIVTNYERRALVWNGIPEKAADFCAYGPILCILTVDGTAVYVRTDSEGELSVTSQNDISQIVIAYQEGFFALKTDGTVDKLFLSPGREVAEENNVWKGKLKRLGHVDRIGLERDFIIAYIDDGSVEIIDPHNVKEETPEEVKAWKDIVKVCVFYDEDDQGNLRDIIIGVKKDGSILQYVT